MDQINTVPALAQHQPRLLGRTDIIRTAAKYLPTTAEGMLAGFFRPDMLPMEATTQEAVNPKTTDAAIIPLSYVEGFPTLPDGRPFWHKLDFESAAAFACFESYTALANDGPRHLAALLDSPEVIRVLSHVTNPLSSPVMLATLQEFHTLYFWRDRARAYDLYREAAYRHIRTRRALSADDTNYTRSTQLIEKLFTMLSAPDVLDNLKYEPDKLVAMLEKLTRLQRVSVGMPATAPVESQKEVPGDQAPATFEYFMRRVTQSAEVGQAALNSSGQAQLHARSQEVTLDESGRVVPTTDNLLRGALNDPGTARMLQEVIIKVSTQNGASRRPRWYKGEVSDDANDFDSPDEEANGQS